MRTVSVRKRLAKMVSIEVEKVERCTCIDGGGLTMVVLLFFSLSRELDEGERQ